VSLPVGSGKTEIFSHLIHKIPTPAHVPTATKTLVLAHKEELIDQAWAAIRRIHPEAIVDIDKGEVKASPSTSDIVVASGTRMSYPLLN
jgi:ATP-dependent helicase IRC3